MSADAASDNPKQHALLLLSPPVFMQPRTDKALCSRRCRGKLLTVSLQPVDRETDPICLTAAAPLQTHLYCFCLFDLEVLTCFLRFASCRGSDLFLMRLRVSVWEGRTQMVAGGCTASTSQLHKWIYSLKKKRNNRSKHVYLLPLFLINVVLLVPFDKNPQSDDVLVACEHMDVFHLRALVWRHWGTS